MNVWIKRPLSSGSTKLSDLSLSRQQDRGDTVDYIANPDLYFAELSKLHKHAQKTHQKENEDVANLSLYLPLIERLSLNKEEKVLTKWQERQKDWERVQNVVSKKIGSKVSRPLMMSTTDEYRARMEEYDLIQAAIPLRERFPESSWVMSLRGGGPIRVSVGHIFSGLECAVDVIFPKPKIFRKPKSNSDAWKTETFMPQSHALQNRRKQLMKTITEIRPRDVTFKDADALVVKSISLFKWAKDSSQDYLDNLNANQTATQFDEMMSNESKHSLYDQDIELYGKQQQNIPKIEFLSSKDLLFQTTVGVECRQEVCFRNISNTVVYYQWERSPKIKDIVDNNKGKYISGKHKVSNGFGSLGQVLDSKGEHDDDTRSHILYRKRDYFFCLQNNGELLPNEMVSIPFVFRDSAGGGYYASEWTLRLTPQQTKIIATNSAAANNNNNVNVNVNVNVNSLIGSITIHLSAHCLLLDENVSKRQRVRDHFEASILRTFMKDIIQDCLSRVRQPIRQADMERRQIALFQEKNREFLEELTAVRGKLQPPLFFSAARIQALQAVKHDTAAFYTQLLDLYDKVLDEYHEFGHAPRVTALQVTVADLYTLTAEDYDAVLQKIFPEGILVS
jgi:hypothetical protein